jgi:hypothetical protein
LPFASPFASATFFSSSAFASAKALSAAAFSLSSSGLATSLECTSFTLKTPCALNFVSGELSRGNFAMPRGEVIFSSAGRLLLASAIATPVVAREGRERGC